MTHAGTRKRPLKSRDSKFDESGEELDDNKNRFVKLDRYLATQPGSRSAVEAMRELLEHYQR